MIYRIKQARNGWLVMRRLNKHRWVVCGWHRTERAAMADLRQLKR